MADRRNSIRPAALAALCCLLLSFLIDLMWGVSTKSASMHGPFFGQAIVNSGLGGFLGYALFFRLRKCRISLSYFFLAYLLFEAITLHAVFLVIRPGGGAGESAFVLIFSAIRAAIVWGVVAVVQKEQERHGTIPPGS